VRVLVTGGNGFLGYHLCRQLLDRGDSVLSLDNFATSDPRKLSEFNLYEEYEFIEADVCDAPDIVGRVDAIAHLACPASPPEYLRLPLETLAIGSRGSEFVLDLARERNCRVLLASTSEVYGDPLEHPQKESYWGNVNPVGPRSVYDESKRFAEAMFSAYRRTFSVNTAIVRIFNTYGPGLRPHDGRVVSNFIAQALRNEPLTMYGEGTQTRSFCYVSDLVGGLLRMLASQETGPINLGNPNEITILELATLIKELTGSTSEIVHLPLPQDDPTTRRPDITVAKAKLDWTPQVALRDGLAQTILWQQSLLTH
jgi:dTDP-glucose 4,6-dehydratase